MLPQVLMTSEAVAKKKEREDDSTRPQALALPKDVERLLEAVPAAVWVAQDPLCLTITGNRRANDFCEARASENVSATTVPGTRRFFSPDGRELAASELPMQKAVATNEDVRDCELHVLLPSGRRKAMLGSAIPLRDEAGNIRGCISAFLDITDVKRNEEALRELNETLKRRVAERTAEVERSLQQLRAMTTDLTLAEHRERQRIAKVVHDHLQQLLVAAMLNVDCVQTQMADPRIRECLDQLRGLLNDGVKASRSLTAELFPPVLREGTFAEALRWLIQWMREKHDLEVHHKLDEQTNPGPDEIRLLVFEATRELLFNIVKHAGVREACLEMTSLGASQVRVMVADSGRGFDASTLQPALRTEGGFGMVNIRERLRLLGGHIEIQSTPGHGTCATLVAPLRPQLECGEKV